MTVVDNNTVGLSFSPLPLRSNNHNLINVRSSCVGNGTLFFFCGREKDLLLFDILLFYLFICCYEANLVHGLTQSLCARVFVRIAISEERRPTRTVGGRIISLFCGARSVSRRKRQARR